MKTNYLKLLALLLIPFGITAQTKGLIISQILAKPSGTESPYEYVELIATQNINFATTPYTVVAADDSATSSGWIKGSTTTYAFQINTGSVTAGQVVYVGGSSMLPLSNSGVSLRSINTSTTAGDVFGSKNTSGVFGNGGSNMDGVAVFNMAAASITASTVPVDAIFYGSGVGSEYDSSSAGYQLPVNDNYSGGKVAKTSFYAPDPAAGDLVTATGVFNASTNTWTTARTWATTQTATYNTSSVTVTGGNVPPTVTLATPTVSGVAPATVTLSATAADSDGTVAKVDFYNGSTLLGTDTTSPYTYSWTNVAAGTYTVTAKAYDNSGASTTSSSQQVVVSSAANVAPTVSLAAPTVSGVAPATVTLSATAADSDGTIAKVDFYNGATLLGTVTTSPYTYSWTNVAAGTYTLTAKATDNGGAATTSSSQQITVNPGTNQPPTVTLTSPANNAIITAPGTVSITATAADADGTVAKVEFYNGSTLLNSDTSSPYSYSWTSVAAGTYTITAKAYDNLGAVTTSTAATILLNVAPTIAFNQTASYLVNETSGTISVTMGDANDPVMVSGLDINVTDESLSTLTFSMTSSSTAVVPTANLTVTGTGTARKVIITPKAVGYTTITLKVTDNGGLNKTIQFQLGVSQAYVSAAPSNYYHTGISDASAVVAIDATHMFIGDDETNYLSLYDRNKSGLPIYTFDPTKLLGLTDDLEVDIEACFVSPTNPNRIYWFGSQGNSKKGNIKPDRDRVFATDIVGSGATATLKMVGYYQGLRAKILTWGDANGFNLTADAADGQIPKLINGYNIEGATMAPDNTTAYIAFRAPYVPAGTQNKALICPIANFEAWFNAGAVTTSPTFGSPIELDLGVRGFRDIVKNASNQYVIVAGAYDGTANFALYSWNGQAATAPVALNANLANLSPEAVIVPASLTGSYQVELISDNGGDIIYGDGVDNKDITTLPYQKFVSSVFTIGGTGKMAQTADAPAQADEIFGYPNPVSANLNIVLGANQSKNVACNVYNSLGALVKTVVLNNIEGQAAVDLSDLNSGLYFVNLPEAGKTLQIMKK